MLISNDDLERYSRLTIFDDLASRDAKINEWYWKSKNCLIKSRFGESSNILWEISSQSGKVKVRLFKGTGQYGKFEVNFFSRKMWKMRLTKSSVIRNECATRRLGDLRDLMGATRGKKGAVTKTNRQISRNCRPWKYGSKWWCEAYEINEIISNHYWIQRKGLKNEWWKKKTIVKKITLACAQVMHITSETMCCAHWVAPEMKLNLCWNTASSLFPTT